MKILAFSDLHRDAAMAEAVVRESHNADVVVGAGDFATRGLGLEDTLPILRRMAVPFVLVAGNHDAVSEVRSACADWPQAPCRHWQAVVLDGVPVVGVGL